MRVAAQHSHRQGRARVCGCVCVCGEELVRQTPRQRKREFFAGCASTVIRIDHSRK